MTHGKILSVDPRVFDGRNNRSLMSSDYLATGLPASARVIPEGFIGQHRRMYACMQAKLRTSGVISYAGCREMHRGFRNGLPRAAPLVN